MLRGVFTALVTPFRDDALDEHALRELVDAQIEAGISGLVPCGTTGESVNLSTEEHARVVRIVVEQTKGRVPVLAGTGTASTHHTVELSRLAKDAGADGLLLVCPYYNRPTQAGLEAHFRHVVHQVSLPTMLYNIPGRTGVDLALDTLAALANVKEIVAIKEATGSAQRSKDIVARFGDRFAVLSGDDALTLDVMTAGGTGLVSVTSNVAPKQVSDVVGTWAAGDVAGAAKKHEALMPLHLALFVESNPGPVKYALSLRSGLAPEIRLPLVWPSRASQAHVRAALDKVLA